MSDRPRRRGAAKKINYARLNSVGKSDVEDSEGMSEMDNPDRVKEATEEGEVTDDGVTAEKEAAGDTEEPAVELSEADIDARVVAAKREQDELASKIRVQKKLQMLDALERENKRLRDELARVESESDGAWSLLRAPGESRQQSSESVQKGRERRHKSKVKAGPATNSSYSTTKTGHKQSTQNITDLRRNLSLCNEADEALNVLGVPLNTGAVAESSDSSAQESDGPRRRVKKSSKSRSNKKSSHVKSSHKDNVKRAESMFDGWGRLVLSEAPSEGQWSGFEESVVMWPNENLGPRYNNYGKAETKYRQLDMRTLVAGELDIVCDCGVSMREREARLRLLGDVNFYSAHYQWSALLKFHAAVCQRWREVVWNGGTITADWSSRC